MASKKGRKSGGAKTRVLVLRFLISMILFIVAEYLLLYVLPPESFRTAPINFTAGLFFRILELLGFSASLSGAVIQLRHISLEIVYECTGVFAFFILSGAILAYPSRGWHKLLGHIVGLPAVFILNIIRLVVLAVIGEYFSLSVFNFVHEYLWQITFIVVVLLFWVLWIDRVVEHAKG
ncbi:MAG: hypothetical protein B6D65_04950 [candidate division Zixibacteria bacterium 4484_93]|nr:MAG: hypothetical protein B6D65_04950 [candidate division Zixibacteria bacterium 4484_93]